MPSSGDWTLHRGGAITAQGTERLAVEGCLLTHVDGNCLSVNGYHRNLSVTGSEFALVGESAIALWGFTEQGRGGGSVALPRGVGIDGTGGEQPRGTLIEGNIVREVGLVQKQASALFQATSCQTRVQRNVFYNGPRAMINLNDQFGGSNLVSGNLMANSCRETADHGVSPAPARRAPPASSRSLRAAAAGPINSWGRTPFITEVRDGTPSITPAVTEVAANLIFADYPSQEAVDNADSSECAPAAARTWARSLLAACAH